MQQKQQKSKKFLKIHSRTREKSAKINNKSFVKYISKNEGFVFILYHFEAEKLENIFPHTTTTKKASENYFNFLNFQFSPLRHESIPQSGHDSKIFWSSFELNSEQFK
jgi:hypothetical protein